MCATSFQTKIELYFDPSTYSDIYPNYMHMQCSGMHHLNDKLLENIFFERWDELKSAFTLNILGSESSFFPIFPQSISVLPDEHGHCFPRIANYAFINWICRYKAQESFISAFTSEKEQSPGSILKGSCTWHWWQVKHPCGSCLLIYFLHIEFAE